MQLFFIGDSLTLGVGDQDRLGWAGRICKRFDPEATTFDAYNLGVRASTTRDIEARWEAEVLPRVKSDSDSLLVFSFGAADFANGLPAEQSCESANSILQQASAKHKTIYISPPPMKNQERDNHTKKLTKEVLKICNLLDIPALNINLCLRKNDPYLSDITAGDGVHPSKIGYEIMSECIFNFLTPHIRPFLD